MFIAQEEIFPLVNESGELIGQAPRSVCHNGSKLLHPVIHLHVFNSVGELFLQKRSLNKDIQPGKWDTAVAGHVALNESALKAVQREALEELGIAGFKPVFISKYIFECEVEKELVYTFKTVYNGRFILNEEEISEGRFWSREEIRINWGTHIFTPNFEEDILINRLFQY